MKLFQVKLLKIIVLSIVIGLFETNSKAQLFDTFDENYIKIECYNLLKSYEILADFTEDGINISEDYKEAFKTICSNYASGKIYNDLAPKGGYITPVMYVNSVEHSYPHGIETKIDSSSISFLKPKWIKDNVYSIVVVADKYVIGINKANKIFRKDITAYFTILFNYSDEDQEFDQFSIAEILNEETLLQNSSDDQLKGFHLGANLLSGASGMWFQNGEVDYLKERQFPLSFGYGLSLTYYFNRNYSISTGVSQFVYQTHNRLEYSNGQNNNILRMDRDGDNYYLHIDSKIDEYGKFTFLQIPLAFSYRHGLAGDISFFASLTIKSSFLSSSQLEVIGQASQAGFYPELNLYIDDAQFYDFGLTDYNNTYDVTLSGLQFYAGITAGVSIPVGKTSYINAGVNYQRNVSDINYKTPAYRDDYLSINKDSGLSFIQSLSLSVSYTIKIF